MVKMIFSPTIENLINNISSISETTFLDNSKNANTKSPRIHCGYLINEDTVIATKLASINLNITQSEFVERALKNYLYQINTYKE